LIQPPRIQTGWNLHSDNLVLNTKFNLKYVYAQFYIFSIQLHLYRCFNIVLILPIDLEKTRMLAKELYRIIATEKNSIQFLQEQGIICMEKECPTCGKFMSKDLNRGRWRCRKRACDIELSMKADNEFFVQGGLPMKDVLELLWMFLYSRMTIAEASYATNHSTSTVTFYYKRFRKICTLSMNAEPKMYGTKENPVQVDESFFSGQRKYNKGRLLAGNKKKKYPDDDNDDLPADWNEDDPKHYNFGKDDPRWCWVVGIYSSKTCVRFIRVRNRAGATIVPLIEKYVEKGSLIHTDEWRGYNNLKNHGYTRKTVCHKEHYVDPDTGVHTQGVERSWRTVKLRLRCGVGNRKYQQSHLDEMAWRMLHSEDHLSSLFIAFLDDVKTHYGN